MVIIKGYTLFGGFYELDYVLFPVRMFYHFSTLTLVILLPGFDCNK